MPDKKNPTGGVLRRASYLFMVCILVLTFHCLVSPTVLAADQPDLLIQSLSLTPQEPKVGDTVTITVNVKNQGSGNAASSQVVCYVDATIIGTNSIDALGPGTATTTSFQWTAQNGTHTIRAACDSGESISESDENNNELIYTLTPLAPDLVIDSISWSPSAPSVGDAVIFTISISNNGNTMAQTTTLNFYIDGNSRGIHDIPRINPGEKITDTYSWTTLSGQHSIKAFIDNNYRIAESNENNNEKTVTFSTEAPDLEVVHIIADPITPSENEEVTFSVLLTNKGTGHADNCHLNYTIDGEIQPILAVPELDAGASVNITFTWKALLGTHEFNVAVDIYDRLSESDENNNTGYIKTSTLVPDLIVEDITWSPDDPGVGDIVKFTVSVKNKGAGTAGSTRIIVYIDGKFQGHYVISPLEQNKSTSATFQWEAGPGPHVISVVADYDEIEKESYEDNNQLTKTISVVPPDLTISGITWAPEYPNLGDTVTFSVNITNKSGGKAENFHVGYYIDDELITSVPVTSLAAEASALKMYNWKSKEGRHTFTASIDLNNYIEEENENNNDYTVTIVPNMADLVVQAVTWSPMEVVPGTQVTFNIDIKNTGTLTTVPSRITYQVDDANMGYSDIGPVKPGEIITEKFIWPASSANHRIFVIADSTGLIQEIDEDNNTRLVTLPPPDIVVDSVSWEPEGSRIGETVVFSVVLKNNGRSATQPCTALCGIDGESPSTAVFPEIAAGSTGTGTFEWIAMKGSHVLTVTADNLNTNIESDETNNKKTIDFTTLTPDLKMGNITWRMEDPLLQSEVFFTITVQNTGTDTAPCSTLNYAFDAFNEVRKEVPEIPAGESTEISIKAILPAGDHKLALKLDADEIVTELDETNNLKTYEFNTSAADLIVKSISWTPLDAGAGDNVTISASIENRGKNKASDIIVAFLVDDTYIGETTLDEVGIGETLVGEFVWTVESGLHQIGVSVDYDDNIPESDETNNTSTRTFSLGGPLPAGDDQVKLPITNEIPEESFLAGSWMLILLIAFIFAGAAFYLLFRSFRKE